MGHRVGHSLGVRGCGCAVGDGGVCNPCGPAPASAADQQREDRHHRVDEECPGGTEMLSGLKYELV